MHEPSCRRNPGKINSQLNNIDQNTTSQLIMNKSTSGVTTEISEMQLEQSNELKHF